MRYSMFISLPPPIPFLHVLGANYDDRLLAMNTFTINCSHNSKLMAMPRVTEIDHLLPKF